MLSAILMVLLSGALWWWYFTLRADARKQGFDVPWMFPTQLSAAWLVTLLTLLYLAVPLFTSAEFGDPSWL